MKITCPCCNHELIIEEKEAVEIKWYARCGIYDRLGPFKTQLEAVEVTRKMEGGHYDNAFVYCEEASIAAKRDIPWDLQNPLFKNKDKS